MSNIVLFTLGTHGDVLPFIGLGTALRKRGHQVTLVTYGVFEGCAGAAGIRVVPVDAPEDYPTYLESHAAIHTRREDPTRVLAYLRRRKEDHEREFLHHYNLLVEQGRSTRTIYAGGYHAGLAVSLAAERVGAPLAWIVLNPTEITVRAGGHDPAGTIVDAEVPRLRATLRLPACEAGVSWQGYARRTICLWPPWFGDCSSLPLDLLLAGFVPGDDVFSQEPPAAILDYARRERPVLITGGTSVLIPPRFFQAAVGACQLLGYPAILVTGHHGLVPDGLSTTAPRVASLPLATMMPLMRAVIHHGGSGTLGRALTAGVPQVVLAHGLDRPDNAQRLQRLGVGAYLPIAEWQPERVAEAVTWAITSTAVAARCAERAATIAKDDAASRACRALESLLPLHGSGMAPREVQEPDCLSVSHVTR